MMIRLCVCVFVFYPKTTIITPQDYFYIYSTYFKENLDIKMFCVWIQEQEFILKNDCVKKLFSVKKKKEWKKKENK